MVVLWLNDATEKSSVQITGETGFRFSLDELIEKGELSASMGGVTVKANFLLDREIGEISLEDFGASAGRIAR